MKGSIEDAIAICHSEFINILLNLKTALTVQIEPLLKNPVFKSIGIILNLESYQFHDADVLYDEVKVADHFKSMLMINGCPTEHLKEEFEILHNHIKRSVLKNKPEKCWQIIFNIGCDLGIRYFLHVIEICLVIPLSNAKSKRVSSFLWRLSSKKRQLLKQETLISLLHERSDNKFSPERFTEVVNMSMMEFIDGLLRKHKRHLQDHQYPKSVRKTRRDVTGAIKQSLLSDDEDNVIVDDEDMAQPEVPLIPQDISLEDISENSD